MMRITELHCVCRVCGEDLSLLLASDGQDAVDEHAVDCSVDWEYHDVLATWADPCLFYEED